MTTILHEIYDHLPDAVQVPEALRHQRGEVIILPLGDDAATALASHAPQTKPAADSAPNDQAALWRLRAFRGRLPAGFVFNRDQAQR